LRTFVFAGNIPKIPLSPGQQLNEEKRFAAAHDALVEKRNAAQAAARKKTPIDPLWLCASLNAAMPKDTVYIDEVTTQL
jgi:hypothetical protein